MKVIIEKIISMKHKNKNILFVIFFIGSTNLYLGLPDGKYIMSICAKGSALYIELISRVHPNIDLYRHVYNIFT
jgi:hypothetical protein